MNIIICFIHKHDSKKIGKKLKEFYLMALLLKDV